MYFLTEREFEQLADVFDNSNSSTPHADRYQLLFSILQTADRFGNTAEPNVRAWFGAASQINRGEGGASNLIRDFTESQLEIRTGQNIDNVQQLLQNASDAISAAVFSDILSRETIIEGETYYPLPTLRELGQFDVGEALNQFDGFSSDPSVWSGNLFFVGLNERSFWDENVINDSSNTYKLFTTVSSFYAASLGPSLWADNGAGIVEASELFVGQGTGAVLSAGTSVATLGSTIGFVSDAYGSVANEGILSFVDLVVRPLILGSDNSESVNGGPTGFPTDQYIHSGSGNDTILGSRGLDLIDGGSGVDRVTWETFPSIDLTLTMQRLVSDVPYSGYVEHEQSPGEFGTFVDSELFDIEEVVLSASADTLVFNDFTNITSVDAGSAPAILGGDVVDARSASTGVQINLLEETLSESERAITIQNFEDILGTAFNDVLNGTNPSDDTGGLIAVSTTEENASSNGANILEGGAGNDQIDGLGGEDVLRGMANDDVINGGPPVGANGNEAADRIEGGSGDDAITIQAGEAYGQGDDDVIAIFGGVAGGPDEGDPAVRAYGGSGNDTLDASGSSGSHFLSGGSGSDTLYGNGNSVLSGGTGADAFYMTAGDTIVDPEAHDDLFYNGVEIRGDGNDILWGWEIGPVDGRAYIPFLQNGEGLRSDDNPFTRRAVEAEIAVVFEITGLADDFDGTADGVIHTLHIFENVQFDETGTLGIPPIDQQFRLFDAVARIEDWRPGDFGLFPAYGNGPMANSLDLRERLTLDGEYFPLLGIELGDPRFLSSEAREAEATFEELTENLSDEWLSVQDEASTAAPTEDADLFTGEGPASSGGGGADTFVLSATANVASGGADADLMVGFAGNDTLNGDTGNDRIYGNEAPGADIYSAFEGFGDEPVDPGGPTIPFDPPANEYEQGYNDGFAVGFAEMGEMTNPPLGLPFTDYEIGFADGYFAGFDAFFLGGEGDGDGESTEPEVLPEDNDNLFGGTGDDTIYGDRGDDLIEGNEDNDQLYGESGNDTINGGSGIDIIEGGEGNDSLSGGEDADEMRGGDGNDTLLGGAGDDAVFGNAGNDDVSGGDGNDTVSGGEGDDVIHGDAGDDVIIASTGNDLVYGGTGDDTISGDFGDHTYYYARGDGSDTILDGGPFAFANTDRIVFTDIDSTEVEYRRDGDDFTILLSDGERITSERQFRLGNDGIEFIDFADNVSVEIGEGIVEEAVVTTETTNLDDGRVLVTTFEDGVKTSATMTDVADVYAWSEYTDSFDLDGNRVARDTIYDDGREAQNTYVNGLLAASLITDLADEFDWNAVERAFDESGNQTGQTNTYDDGRLLETVYTDGVRSSAEMTDVNNAYAWTSYSDSFDANGDLALRTITYDDGRVTETTSTGGVTSSSTITDIDNAYTWDTIERGYDDMGMQVSQLNTYDDGRVLDLAYVDGVRATGTTTDSADVYAWASYVDTFDGDGTLAARSMIYDDGRVAETAYVAGVRSESLITDAGNAYDWTSVQHVYDASGTQTAQTTTYDDGRILETAFTGGVRATATMTDVANAYAWTSYIDTYDGDGIRTSRSTTYDDGRETLNTYVDEVLASSFTNDVADEFVWDTIDKSYDDMGVPTEQTNTYDDGRVLQTLYAEGIRTTATMTDVADAFAWDNYVDTFDDNGDLATRLMTFDDGREVFTDYLA